MESLTAAKVDLLREWQRIAEEKKVTEQDVDVTFIRVYAQSPHSQRFYAQSSVAYAQRHSAGLDAPTPRLRTTCSSWAHSTTLKARSVVLRELAGVASISPRTIGGYFKNWVQNRRYSHFLAPKKSF